MSFIILTFVSSMGDTVFLAGMPLFFFTVSKGSLSSTVIVPTLLITAVILCGPVIKNITRFEPLALVGYGELLMGGLEVLGLWLTFYWRAEVVMLPVIFVLAIIYNAYAPSKYFRLQSVFFGDRANSLTPIQAGAMRVGALAGVAVCGYLLRWFGLAGILLFDAASFCLFGLFMLRTRRGGSSAPAVADGVPSSTTPGPTNRTAAWPIAFVAVGVALLFAQWEQSSGIATIAKVYVLGIPEIGLQRALFGLLGACTAMYFGARAPAAQFRLFSGTLGVLAILSALSPLLPSIVVAGTLFFCGGIIFVLLLPVQRLLYEGCTSAGRTYEDVVSSQWIYATGLRAMIIPIVLATEHFAQGHSNILALSLVCIMVLGCLGGLVMAASVK